MQPLQISELFRFLTETELPDYLVVVGLVFLFIAVVGDMGRIETGRTGRLFAGLVGTVLLVSGSVIGVGMIPNGPGTPTATSTPTPVPTTTTAPTVLGFEGFEGGTELTDQYRDDGVIFEVWGNASAGVIVGTCDSEDSLCTSARNGRNVVQTPVVGANILTGEIARAPLVALFTEPTRRVSLSVREAEVVGGSQTAGLVARNRSGDVVAETAVRFDAGTGWHRITVSARSATIHGLTLTLADADDVDNPHNALIVDDLTFQDWPPTARSPLRQVTPGNSVSINRRDPTARVWTWDCHS